MDRTVRAALLAAVIAFAAVAGMGAFLVPGATVAATVAGLVAGALAALLVVAAARRADSFASRPTPVRPSHPGPPEPAGEDPEPDEASDAGPHPSEPGATEPMPTEPNDADEDDRV